MSDVSEELARDPDAWARSNPSLGDRISIEAIQREFGALDRRSFACERLGCGDWPDTTLTHGRLITPEAWAACIDDGKTHPMPPRPCIAFDVTPDHRMSSVAAAAIRPDGRVQVELVEHRAGVGWLPEVLSAITSRHRPPLILCDGRSPAAGIQLDGLRPAVRTLNGQEYAAAVGSSWTMFAPGPQTGPEREP